MDLSVKSGKEYKGEYRKSILMLIIQGNMIVYTDVCCLPPPVVDQTLIYQFNIRLIIALYQIAAQCDLLYVKTNF